MLKHGARGYVVKANGVGELMAAIRAVAGGKPFLPAEAPDGQGGWTSNPAVLALVAAGQRTLEIAERPLA